MTMIGAYGPWMAELADDPPRLSFRKDKWTEIDAWREVARPRVLDCLAMLDNSGVPQVTVHDRYVYDGLHIEELSWQLPYGPRTEAILLKPSGSRGRLPGILALHDHAGNKYFGKRKIARTSDVEHHPLLKTHASDYYGGLPWANEVAKRGYVVLVPDAFSFGSRRVRLADVTEHLRQGVVDTDLKDEPHNEEAIKAYNQWAAAHEPVMAKSLFSAGTTWPGVFLGEDQRALDVLCARDDVDDTRIGCGGLSGGGLRTVYLGGIDPRIECAVCVGMMTTWRDYLLNVSWTHTWMVYPPGLPLDLDYPEILGLRAPLPTMVLSNTEDPLFTLSEMERADDILRQVYRKAGASNRYQSSFHPGGHKFDLPMQTEAFDWFDKWLG